jgi:hypothetical protein
MKTQFLNDDGPLFLNANPEGVNQYSKGGGWRKSKAKGWEEREAMVEGKPGLETRMTGASERKKALTETKDADASTKAADAATKEANAFDGKDLSRGQDLHDKAADLHTDAATAHHAAARKAAAYGDQGLRNMHLAQATAHEHKVFSHTMKASHLSVKAARAEGKVRRD